MNSAKHIYWVSGPFASCADSVRCRLLSPLVDKPDSDQVVASVCWETCSSLDVSDALAPIQHPISGRQLAHDLLRRVLFLLDTLMSSVPAHDWSERPLTTWIN
jgi:hypothetical protein